MENKAIFETTKMVIRLAILWLPLLLTFVTGLESEGLLAAISIALTSGDKYIHESEKIKLNGIIPF